jgi:hypothetical protein
LVDLNLRPGRAASGATSRRPHLNGRRTVAALLACALGATLLTMGGSAAALNGNRIGGLDDRGFPRFYMDQAGRALQLCVDGSALCQGVGPNALAGRDGEAFYWVALTPLKTSRGTLSVEMAIEAAFEGQRPVVFRRLRVRGHLNRRGNYLLRYPYGAVTIHAIATGNQRNVDFTLDRRCALADPGRCAPRMHRWLKSTTRAPHYLGTRTRTPVTGGTKRNVVQLVARNNGKLIGRSRQFRVVGKVCGRACRRG